MTADRTATEARPSPSIAERIWDIKYRFKTADGTPVDRTLADTFRRVARFAASAEAKADRKRWETAFFEAMVDLSFIPAGRILAGAGTKRRVTLFNCFVMGHIEDDLSSIFENVREAALTMQQGGGIGHDFSTLRPRGAVVRSVGADASGPVSFMDVWDAMCRTIMSAGQRRGAMMATLRCDHPDILEFVTAKADPARLRNFNLSVLVTDAFIDAVRTDASWPLVFDGKVYRTIGARDLWRQIMRSTYDTAEPGVIFIDRVNAANNLAYCETISATNPCGEQPLPPYGACLLGSINLSQLVRDPFTTEARLDTDHLAALARTAVRFLDDVVDVSRYPLPAQRDEARAKRRLGLGVTGLADALIKCGVRYGSSESLHLAAGWMACISHEAYRASAALASEKGAFPLCDVQALLKRPNITRLPADIRAEIGKHGLRNGLLTSIAPTGTISLLAGNVSSGIEPVFDFRLKRRMLDAHGTAHEDVIEDAAVRAFRLAHGESAPLPPAFVRAADLSPRAHLEMQAALQAHVDSSISKTINCPEDIPFEAFERIYMDAYELGLKGCTTYRPNPITGAVLTAAGDDRETGMAGLQASTATGALPSGVPSAGAGPARPEPAGAVSVDIGAGAPAGTAGDSPVAPVSAVSASAVRMETPAAGVPASAAGEIVYMTQPLERDQILTGFTYKLRWPDSDHAIYITLNDIEREGRRRPFEIFINSKNLEHYAWTVALTRMISAVFRRGGDVTFVVDELKAVFDPRGGQWLDGRYVPSLLAAIGGVIELHMIRTGFLRLDPGVQPAIDRMKAAPFELEVGQPNGGVGPDREDGPTTTHTPSTHTPSIPTPSIQAPSAGTPSASAAPRARPPGNPIAKRCPRCSMPSLMHQEGCLVCLNCGYSKCG